MDAWTNFILIIYISGEKEQKNVLFHHLIQISGEIRHFLVQCPHSTRKCLISPLTKCSISPLALIRWNKISGEIRHFSVESQHRFPVLFLLPRFTIDENLTTIQTVGFKDFYKVSWPVETIIILFWTIANCWHYVSKTESSGVGIMLIICDHFPYLTIYLPSSDISKFKVK